MGTEHWALLTCVAVAMILAWTQTSSWGGVTSSPVLASRRFTALAGGIVVAAKAFGVQEYMTQEKLKGLLDRLGQ